MSKKLTNGRQKVPIAKMEKKSNLQVTFSKRRTGLFKKACEFCTLTGAQLLLVVFSPGQKAYSFGHPCPESVIEKYLGKSPLLSVDGSTSRNTNMAIHCFENINELNQKLINFEKLFEAEKRREKLLDQMRNKNLSKYWWKAPIEELNLDQLEKLEKALSGVKKKIENEFQHRKIQAANLSRFLSDGANFGRNVEAFCLNISSPLGATVIDPPIKIDLNIKAPGIDGSDMPDEV